MSVYIQRAVIFSCLATWRKTKVIYMLIEKLEKFGNYYLFTPNHEQI